VRPLTPLRSLACLLLLVLAAVAELAASAGAQGGTHELPRSRTLPTPVEDELLDDFTVEERTHRMRLAKLRRLYLLARAAGWSERLEEIEGLAERERERHARARAAVHVQVRADVLSAFEETLAVGRERELESELPEVFEPSVDRSKTAARIPESERTFQSVQRQKMLREERQRAQLEELRARARKQRVRDRLNENLQASSTQVREQRRAPSGETRVRTLEVEKKAGKPKASKP
jgi:hypothetical protein